VNQDLCVPEASMAQVCYQQRLRIVNISAFTSLPPQIGLYTPVAVAFYSPKLNSYIYGGYTKVLTSRVTILSRALINGRMGEMGAVYHLASDLMDQEGHRFRTELQPAGHL
jgi:hypothetical protein